MPKIFLSFLVATSALSAGSLMSKSFDYATNYVKDSVKSKDSYLNLSVGTWYINWKQDDYVDNKDIDKNKQIEHKFTIDNSFATELSLNGKWKFISGNFDYVLADNSAKVNQYLGKLNFNTHYLDTSMRYIHTRTEGISNGYDHTTRNDSHIEFDTTLDIFDVSLFPNIAGYKYFGLGYRYTNYKLPQTIYVLSNNKVTYQGVEKEMQWEGHFITMSYDMSRVVLEKIAKNQADWDWYFNALGGYGFSIVPSAKTVSQSGNNAYLKGKTGYFYELEAGAVVDIANFKNIMHIAGKVGYRYDYQLLETKKETNAVYIYARAESEWSGPFVNLNFLF